MVGSLALHQHLAWPYHHNYLKDQNSLLQPTCLVPLHQVKTMEDFRKAHAQFLKLGLDCIPPYAGELLSACALSAWGSLDYALAIFLNLEEPCTFEYNVMIRAKVNHDQSKSALQLYKEMIERSINPDNFTFPFVLKACALLSDIRGGIQLHGHAIKLGFDEDVFIHNSLINLYGKCRKIELSYKIFELMGSNRTIASWSALLSAYNRMNFCVDCLHLFAKISCEKLKPDESSMVAALSSCSNLGLLSLGRSIHCSLLRNYQTLNIIIQTSLIDMYMKCGQPDKGMLIFDKLHEKNSWTYSAVISGLAMHNYCKKALQVFSDMLNQGLKPDEAIYVNVLSACSHAKMVEEGFKCFNQMRFDHQIKPNAQHYGCLADLMIGAGRLDEAYELIQNMPIEPTDAVWRSILSACKINGDIELAESAYSKLEQMEAVNAGDCVILSNMYAELQRWEDAAEARREIASRGLVQAPGFSQVEVKGKMHTFVSHDRSFPESDQVQEMLYQMDWQLRFEGYKTDNLRSSEGQSQKIAIAFALMNTSSVSTIRIFTNLRMCSECHKYTELISKVFERDIIVRDRRRFHHFRLGLCSCDNCW
ncbi:hypothetical protein M5K25_010208 [Dendrobium thyrsiflorum]|uniref:DYW domain-containing protein n=1 Tax=Dendrobium thyrsiflorum TaxID=117978 RepID=A0ABD0UZ37_DENTH